MFAAVVCETYGWTYDEYINQPSFFLELIKEKMVRDNKEKEMQLRKLKNRG